MTQATGCLLIPDSLLHFATSSPLHSKLKWFTGECRAARAEGESGNGREDFAIKTL